MTPFEVWLERTFPKGPMIYFNKTLKEEIIDMMRVSFEAGVKEGFGDGVRYALETK